ncbi:CRP/FNR family transcriptional regulator [Rubricella aquisinus]|uniref:CRP/FNR family transcriptional regulator n=1 Tax=Rubricella aquisinus TaxID=2028108 RepID=A0A840WZ58_9RHOB|nr:CRP/FNR family transcriptional regulator [Rubricella aquisinus]
MKFDARLNTVEQDCADCPIRHNAVCAHCETDELGTLDAMKTYRNFAAGETVIWAGDDLTFLGSVIDGVASLSRTLSDGRRQMVGMLFPSDFVGRPGRSTTPYDVVAATDLRLCTFRKKPFEELIARTPSIERRLLSMTLDELDAAREWMTLLGRKTAREKISSVLLIFARRSAALQKDTVGDGFSFALPVTREVIADYLGLTIETVSRQISALKKEGLITLNGARQVVINDHDALKEQCGDDD